MSDTRISIRVDGAIKAEAKKLYDKLGLDMSTAITLFLKQSIREQSLPFAVTLDTKENRKARAGALNSHNLHSANSVEQLMNKLDHES